VKSVNEGEKYVKRNRQRKKENVDMKKIWHCKGRMKRKIDDKEKNIK
jgi:hypothetical protein